MLCCGPRLYKQTLPLLSNAPMYPYMIYMRLCVWKILDSVIRIRPTVFDQVSTVDLKHAIGLQLRVMYCGDAYCPPSSLSQFGFLLSLLLLRLLLLLLLLPLLLILIFLPLLLVLNSRLSYVSSRASFFFFCHSILFRFSPRLRRILMLFVLRIV